MLNHLIRTWQKSCISVLEESNNYFATSYMLKKINIIVIVFEVNIKYITEIWVLHLGFGSWYISVFLFCHRFTIYIATPKIRFMIFLRLLNIIGRYLNRSSVDPFLNHWVNYFLGYLPIQYKRWRFFFSNSNKWNTGAILRLFVGVWKIFSDLQKQNLETVYILISSHWYFKVYIKNGIFTSPRQV